MRSFNPASKNRPTPRGGEAPSTASPNPATGLARSIRSTEEDAITVTDTIIEELKALAKSMLDATNAARSRANTLESHRSYEALMNAIECRGSTTTANTSIEKTPTSSKKQLQAAILSNHYDTASDSASFYAAHASQDPATHSTAAAAAETTKQPRLGLGVTMPKFSTDSQGNSDEELLIAIPQSLSAKGAAATARKHPTSKIRSSGRQQEHQSEPLQHAACFRAGEDDSNEADDADHDDDDNGKPQLLQSIKAAQERRGDHKQRAITQSVPDQFNSSGTPGEDDDDPDTIYDGVNTQAYFRSTDNAAYKEVNSATWKPEKLLRTADGRTVPCDRGSDDDDDNGTDCSSNSDDDSGYGTTPGSRSRPPTAKKAKAQTVYRVPLFPYGGGITERQFKDLTAMFHDCIRRLPSSSAAVVSQYVTKDAFDVRSYDEVADTAEARIATFQPTSPYDFVVEVAGDVIFNAAKAREERREQFRKMAQEGTAPVTMGTFHLRVVMDPTKTGFEDEKVFPIEPGAIIADRYQIVQLLGRATFSRAVRCYDLHRSIYEDDETRAADPNRTPVEYAEVCLKIIHNSKDFFDQSLDEIRLLTLVNSYKDPDEAHVVRLIDAFYYKEHTMIVTELLSDNLYEYSRYNRDEEKDFYFTLPRLRRIALQVTEALAYVHSLNLIHSDLKPENILFVSHSRCIVKVIDFGSSSFLSDHLSSYVQSRSYRAPEVILGCDYDGRIDVWSLGAILVELVTGRVLFTSETVPEMLARIVYVCGLPFPRHVLWEGRHTSSFINKFGCIYECHSSDHKDDDESYTTAEGPYFIYTPVPPASPTSKKPSGQTAKNKKNAACRSSPSRKEETAAGYTVLREKLEEAGMTDETFLSFVRDCLTLDHKKRPTSAQLLSHPFIVNEKV